jgi:hypothetical protein
MGVLMAFTTSSNMNLQIPGVGTENGPTYAQEINNSLSTIDTHDHSPTKGTQITPAGMNINTTLTANNNFIDQLAGLTLLPQSTTPVLSTIYQSGDDLYFIDGIGNNIRLTIDGGVAGTTGSIANLVAPATASYVAGSSTFVFESNVNIAANMDAASYLFRNISPNSDFAITLSPPDALSLNYSLVLPLLPSVQSFMTLDSAGTMSAPWTVDNTTIKIVANQLVAQSNALSIQKEHAWELNGNYPALSYPLLNIDSIFFAPANITITSVWIYNGDAGTSGTTEFDLKVASSGGSFTSILSTTGKILSTAASNVWTDSGSVIAAQTGVVKPVIATSAITAGQAIKFDLIQSMTGTATDARIRIFYSLA